MSVERQARRALRRMIFWRCVLNLLDLPRDLFRVASSFFAAFADLFDDVSRACFYFELDAARRYRLLTGVDMGVASGTDERYMGTHPDAWESAVEDSGMTFEEAGRRLDEEDDE